jgi:hypothetical protein
VTAAGGGVDDEGAAIEAAAADFRRVFFERIGLAGADAEPDDPPDGGLSSLGIAVEAYECGFHAGVFWAQGRKDDDGA